MSFQPVVPFSGYSGWAFLKRTRENQQDNFNASPRIKRETEYFRARIGAIKTADELVSDRRLLSVALGAFGLGADIGNRFFVKKVLEDGSENSEALANRLSDKRYLEFTSAFGFGDAAAPGSQLSGISARITAAFQEQEFEQAVGSQNEDMRLALSAERELSTILAKDTTDDGRWFLVMGTPPLRRIFEQAMGMPVSIGSLDLDRQLDEYRQRAEKLFGDGEVGQFSDPEKREKLVRRFLLQADIDASISVRSPGSVALAILQGSAGFGRQIYG